MKFKYIPAFIMVLFLASSAASAVEPIAVEPAVQSSASQSSEIFRAVVTGNDQLILNPGAVFTKGGSYEGTQLPYLISNPKPIPYPRWALRQGWQGDLEIALEILKDGHVGRYKVMKSTGHKVLDEAAVEAIHTWRFHPAMKNGKIILTCIQVPVKFQIDPKN